MKTLKQNLVTAILTVTISILSLSSGITKLSASDVIPRHLTASERLWQLATNAYADRAPNASELLADFVSKYPADINANSARLLMADIQFFNHNWPDAVSLYSSANINGLDGDQRSLYSYRKALSMIKTGFFPEARELLKYVKGAKYKNVRNFYTAYIDYIRGDFKSAYKGFEQVAPGIPGLDAEYYMAQIDYTREEYEKVLKITNRLIKNDPVEELAAEIFRINGMSAFKLGEYDKATKSLLKFQELNRGAESPEALYALGVIDYANGQYRRAAKYFQPVTEHLGQLGQSAWLYLGQCRLHENDLQGATLAFDKAANYQVDPNVAQTAMYNYVTALTQGGNIPFSKSAEMLEHYLSRFPNSPHVPAVEEYLAAAYLKDHNYRKAIARVDNAVNPGESMLIIKQRALYEQGVQEAVNGDPTQSAISFRQAANMRNVDAALANQSLLWLADAEYSDGKYSQAAADYLTFIQREKKSANRSLAIYNLAYALFQQKKYQQAADEFDKAMKVSPALGTTHRNDAMMRQADCLYYIGDYNAACDLFARAMQASSTDADYAAYRYAVTMGRSNGARDKINALERFIADYPNSKWVSEALLEKALTHEELGESGAAAESYHRHLALTPEADIDELWRAVQANDIAKSSPSNQISLIQRIISQGNPTADELEDLNLYKANALAQLGEDNEADILYRDLSQNPTGEAGAKSAVILANRLIKHHQYQQALQLMEEFTETGSPHQYWLAKGFIALADCYKALDKPELAREYLLSLKDNYPNTDDDILSIINTRLKELKK